MIPFNQCFTPYFSLLYNPDSIYALSTPKGTSAVAVLRISGPDSLDILNTLRSKIQLSPKSEKPIISTPIPRKLVLDSFYSPETHKLLDNALFVYLPGPNSFTGEDMVEFHLHGSHAVVSDFSSTLSKLCREALPGEFSQRALLNKKMDLTQVEALGDLIHSKTSNQRQIALNSYLGSLSNEILSWKTQLVQLLSYSEAYLDFAEDEELDVNWKDLEIQAQSLIESIQMQIQIDKNRGLLSSSALNCVLLGPPNVGKSSLMNIFTNENTSLVTDIPGTTRDSLKESIDFHGTEIKIIDTAGIRALNEIELLSSANQIEKLGIQRSLENIESAQIGICMFDAKEIHDRAVDSSLNSTLALVNSSQSDIRLIFAFNKLDLLDQNPPPSQFGIVKDLEPFYFQYIKNSFPGISSDRLASSPFCFISCSKESQKTDQLFQVLQNQISDILGLDSGSSHPILTKKRHLKHAANIAKHVNHFVSRIKEPLPQLEIASQDLRNAVTECGHLTGHIGIEEILDVIFSDFCIGK